MNTTKETYRCNCGGTIRFSYVVFNGAWRCDNCYFETSHVRVNNDGTLNPQTFLAEYGARWNGCREPQEGASDEG